MMPSDPSKTGRKANGSMAIEAFRLARISDDLREMRQENVWFSGAVAHGVFFTKSLQDGVSR